MYQPDSSNNCFGTECKADALDKVTDELAHMSTATLNQQESASCWTWHPRCRCFAETNMTPCR